MSYQTPRYCQHFQYLKISEALSVEKQMACRYCLHGPSNVWMCLSRNCSVYVCMKNNLEHFQSHLEQSRKSKKFHSVFINPGTAEIRCIQCNIQVGDLDIPSNQGIKNKQDPFHHRIKLLPGLSELITNKIVGQLQNSQGHRKISKGLVGLFSSKYNYAINAAIQFIAHCRFVKELLLQIKLSQSSKMLKALKEIITQIETAQYRAVYSDTVSELLYKQFPQLFGYKRKDPFENILYFMGIINEEVLYYSFNSENVHEELDEWDMFYKKSKLRAYHIVYSAIQSTLCLNYKCIKCNKELSVPHNIQFLKVNIPKKKRKTKEIEKQLASHRYGSPVKNRRKSLMNLFIEEECPLTVPELIIELMKSPLHKDMNCQTCSQPLRKTKLHFQKLPDILIIQIGRFGKDGGIDETPIQLLTDSLDMGSFTIEPNEQIFYDFQSAVCIEKGCLFPIVIIGQFNKQKYVIRNQIVELCKQKMNPYILCYKKRPTESGKQKLIEIKDDIKSDREKKYILPDFWYQQLENGIERCFKNQFVCKHNSLKPNIQSKMVQPVKVSSFVYQDLNHFYKNFADDPIYFEVRKKSLSGQHSPSMHSSFEAHYQQKNALYSNEVCYICHEEVEQLKLRRKKEREYVLMYDKLKGQSLPYCMISASWIKRWSNFLYNKETFAYMSKGYPLPLSIDNKGLLEGNKCKTNLVKNEDFKLLNIYLWKFLKELYGGGPQIRYKWKEGSQNLDEELICDIKAKAADLKYIFSGSQVESPKKLLMSSLSFIEKSSIMEEPANQSVIRPFPISEELEEHD